jgi:hypothetical protein
VVSDLASAIENLYTAFGENRRPEIIHACPCCMTADEVDVLLAKPLKELTPDELASYPSSALLTVGDVPDYLYFLPRILEISISNEDWWPDIEISGKKIGKTDPASWSSGQRIAINDFFAAAINRILDTKSYRRIDDWMCAIVAAELDVRPFLAAIGTDESAVLEYFNANARCLAEGKLCNAFWELPDPGHDRIVEWFRSAPIRTIPFKAYGYKM